MRKFAGISFATAGFGLILSASSATAITISAPAGLRLGIETNGVVEPIHCRRYGHGHRYGHQWGSGCGLKSLSRQRAAAFVCRRVRAPSFVRRSIPVYGYPLVQEIVFRA